MFLLNWCFFSLGFLPGFTGCALPVLKAMPSLEHNDKKQRSRCGMTALLADIVLNESWLSNGVVPSQLTHLHPDQTLRIDRKLEEVASCLTGSGTEENIFKNSSRKSSQVSCSWHTWLKHSKSHSVICQYVKFHHMTNIPNQSKRVMCHSSCLHNTPWYCQLSLSA